jgi:PncC family amidohydrolase
VGDDELVDPRGERLSTLAGRLQRACLDAGRTVGLAESCTGGLVAAAVTAIPGSSGYFAGGIVSYANEAKRDLLGVDPEILAAHGAVSAQVAREMALRARDRLGADLGGSVTGIAGPDGGSAAKPVGLTYLAVADQDGVDVRRVVWDGDRRANRFDSAAALLELLLERLGATPAASAGAVDAASATDTTAAPISAGPPRG